MKKLSEVTVAGSDYRISLRKLVGVPIVDIVGYITDEFGDATFKMCGVVFENGTRLVCEGEHDLPYLTGFGINEPPNFDDETLQALYDEGN